LHTICVILLTVNMNILFISKNGMAADLARKLHNEGHHVKLYIDDKKLKPIFDYIVPKITNWKKELAWVRKGLIIFDDCGFGKVQDDLRMKGFNVFGGNALADEIEYDREFSTKVFQKYGIKTFPAKTFKNVLEAAEHAIENPGQWVIKREGDNSKFVSYVGEDDDGKDVIALLKNYSVIKNINKQPISLQQRAHGIEIGVARYFNGKKWVGPIEMNVEHPHLFSGGIGQFTTEMGTVAWYTEKENALYKKTLAKLEPMLRESGYKGDFAVNCIVDKKNAYALEMTPRLGSPISHLHQELHDSPWGDFLMAIAKGEDYKLKYKKGYGVVITLAVPPFPFQKIFTTGICHGLTLNLGKCTSKDIEHIHFDEVSKRISGDKEHYYISGHDGFVGYVTSVDKTVKKSCLNALKITQKIHVPKLFYRIDIGHKFEDVDLPNLKKWGWL
jgi:phosphoribosylamine--glycine ligase